MPVNLRRRKVGYNNNKLVTGPMMAVDGINREMDTVAESEQEPCVGTTTVTASVCVENEWAGAGGGRSCLARPNFQA